MTYVVAGVSGNTGSVVAETLIERGAEVRVLVRDAAKGAAWAARGAEVAVASLEDAESLAKAFAGATGAYLLVPPHVSAVDTLSHQAAVVESIATALSRSPVPHVVFLSSVGAHLPDGTGPIVGLHRAESRLRKVPGVGFTFLRPPYFAENLGGSLGGLADGVFPTFLDPTKSMPMIATRDIGVAAAVLLLEGSRGTEVVELDGFPTSPADAAKALGAIVGRELTVQAAPTSVMADVLVGAGLGKDLARLYVEMTDGFNAGAIGPEGGLRRIAPVTPIATVLKALVDGGR